MNTHGSNDSLQDSGRENIQTNAFYRHRFRSTTPLPTIDYGVVVTATHNQCG